MDTLALLLFAVLVLSTLGLVRACDKLGRQDSWRSTGSSARSASCCSSTSSPPCSNRRFS